MPLNRTVWRWMLPLGGTVVIGAVAWRLGVGPFIDGIALVNGPAVLAAAVITGDRFPRTPGRWGVDLGPRHPGLGNRSSSRSARQRWPAYPVLPFWS